MSRVLLISDVHANAPALDAVLAAEPDRDSVVFLGDAVDCGPHPNAVCERLRDLDVAAAVRGNHDRTVLDASGADDTTAGGDDASDDPHAQWQEWTYERLSAENRAFLESLDRTATATFGDRTLRLHHGDFPAPERHDGSWRTRVTPEDDASTFEAVAARYSEDVIVHGHSHFPFEVTVAGTTFVNPGSVGLQRDAWPLNHARYAVLEEDAIKDGAIADGAIDLRSVAYDTGRISSDSLGLDSPYCGYWTPTSASASASTD